MKSDRLPGRPWPARPRQRYFSGHPARMNEAFVIGVWLAFRDPTCTNRICPMGDYMRPQSGSLGQATITLHENTRLADGRHRSVFRLTARLSEVMFSVDWPPGRAPRNEYDESAASLGRLPAWSFAQCPMCATRLCPADAVVRDYSRESFKLRAEIQHTESEPTVLLTSPCDDSFFLQFALTAPTQRRTRVN